MPKRKKWNPKPQGKRQNEPRGKYLDPKNKRYPVQATLGKDSEAGLISAVRLSGLHGHTGINKKAKARLAKLRSKKSKR